MARFTTSRASSRCTRWTYTISQPGILVSRKVSGIRFPLWDGRKVSRLLNKRHFGASLQDVGGLQREAPTTPRQRLVEGGRHKSR
jgi:hypothetical protein